MELSIDTSTRYASVGLSHEGKTIRELSWRSEQNHSVELAPAIRELLSTAGTTTDELRLVVIAIGPGGFSALRVGLSTAKTLTMALDIPLVSVSTLDVEAQPYLGLGLDVCAVIGAGKQRVYLGRYPETGSSKPAYEVVEHEELGMAFSSRTLFCGEGVPDVADMLRTSLGDRAIFVDAPPPTRRAGILARLGYRRWQAGETDDPSSLQPLYLRSAQVDMAQRTWSR